MGAYGIIYRIECLVNGKSYIGITRRTLAHRWKQHRDAFSEGRRSALYAAMRKHGIDNFTITHIASAVTERGLGETEQWLIAAHNTASPHGYNLTYGGDGAAVATEELRQKLRLANKWLDKKQPEEFIERRIAPLRGRKRPLEATLASAAKQRGVKRKSWGKHKEPSKLKMRMKALVNNRESIIRAGAISAAKRRGKKQSAELVSKRAAAIRRARWRNRVGAGQLSLF